MHIWDSFLKNSSCAEYENHILIVPNISRKCLACNTIHVQHLITLSKHQSTKYTVTFLIFSIKSEIPKHNNNFFF